MSFVTSLVVGDTGVVDPTWEQVEAAIASLDAKTVTEVFLYPSAPLCPPDGDHHMVVAGGRDDRCLVAVTPDNLHFWYLEDVSKKDLKTRFYMLVGGQEGDYREHKCVPKAWALAAAREYFETGKRATDLPWAGGD